MIQANELRIGNIVKTDFAGIISVESINESGIGLYSWGNYDPIIESYLVDVEYSFCDLQPIPLTEEIILKCGFIPLSDYLFRMESDEWVEIEIMKDKFYPSISAGEYHIGKELKYLHQLQNLYFALTGQELTINI